MLGLVSDLWLYSWESPYYLFPMPCLIVRDGNQTVPQSLILAKERLASFELGEEKGGEWNKTENSGGKPLDLKANYFIRFCSK